MTTRPRIIANLQPFDRRTYIDCLLSQHNFVPKDSMLWVLEWPARAAVPVHSNWLGLPRTSEIGLNFLGRIPPLVHTLTLDLSQLDDADDARSENPLVPVVSRSAVPAQPTRWWTFRHFLPGKIGQGIRPGWFWIGPCLRSMCMSCPALLVCGAPVQHIRVGSRSKMKF